MRLCHTVYKQIVSTQKMLNLLLLWLFIIFASVIFVSIFVVPGHHFCMYLNIESLWGALTPRPAVAGRRAWLCSSNNCRSSTKPVMCLPSFHPHSKPKGIDAIIPILQMRKSERLNEAPRTVSLAAGNIIQVPLNPSLNT